MAKINSPAKKYYTHVGLDAVYVCRRKTLEGTSYEDRCDWEEEKENRIRSTDKVDIGEVKRL